MHRQFLLALGLSVALTATAFADDWTVGRIRGGVFVLSDGQWEQLARGSVVSDDRVIKSAPGGRATLMRGAESIEISPDTTIQIADAHGFTTVYNHEGVVGIAAEVQNVQHFAVQTQYLAAVVKGTAFVVKTDEQGSKVAVTRGHVEVDDAHYGSTVNISAGEQVASGNEPMSATQVTAISSDMPAPPAPPTPAMQQALQGAAVAPAPAAGPGAKPAAGPAGPQGGPEGRGTGPAADNGPGAGNGPGAADGPGHDKGPGSDKGNSSDKGPGNDKGSGNSGSGNGNGNGNSGQGNSGNGNSGDSGNGNGGGNGKGNNGNGNGNSGGNGNGDSDHEGNGKGHGKKD